MMTGSILLADGGYACWQRIGEAQVPIGIATGL